ncbi:MAG: DUF1588 domain-containing protein [Akkermansiaceae bacterium]|nr:DUF1588 domain-containing protein [Akkermansiaceae bacterium]
MPMCCLRFIGLLVGFLVATEFSALAKTPFLESHCIQCHGSEKQKGEVTLHDLGTDFSDPDTADRWVDVLEQLTAEDMPPEEEEKHPSAGERARMIEWIEGQLKSSSQGDAYRKKLLAPEYGNWVNHEKLFSGEIKTPPYSPSRLWRLSPEIFKSKGFGRTRSPFTYTTPQKGIRDYSAMSQVDQSTVQMVLINAEQFLEHREKNGEFEKYTNTKSMPEEEVLQRTVAQEFRRIVGRAPSEPERAKYLTFLRENIKIGGNLKGLKTTIKGIFLNPEAIYRMEFGLGEKDAHGRRHLSSMEIVNTLAYALTDELPDRNRILWSAYEEGELRTRKDVSKVVRKLLDEQLGGGRWSQPALPRVMRFFEQFFGFDQAGDVFKDNERRRLEAIPQWNTQYLVHDAKMIIEHVLRRDEDVIAELLTTNEYFVAHPGDNEYAREFYDAKVEEVTHPEYVSQQVAKAELEYKKRTKPAHVPASEWEEGRKKHIEEKRKQAEQSVKLFTTALAEGINPHPDFPFSNRSRGLADLIYIAAYSLPPSGRAEMQKWNWPVEQPFEMPAEQRAGILTHPAWLAAWSLNDGNDPIHRGIWVFEKLLAGKLQDVPPDVDAKVPIDPHQTLRERMELLRAERCWNCHHKINPLGEPFEMFDDWGRFRTHVYFGEDSKLFTRRDHQFKQQLEKGKLTSRKINATGAIQGSGDPKVDGKVENAVEMLHRLGRSERARQSFIRHLFRYFMGRNEMLSDSQTLIEAERAYLESKGSFKALVVSLLSSDSFLYRR